jgi:hypothetical protein
MVVAGAAALAVVGDRGKCHAEDGGKGDRTQELAAHHIRILLLDERKSAASAATHRG